MFPSNPLKRPSPADDDQEFHRQPKRFLRPAQKPRSLNDSEGESRHFLMISAIKNIIPKTNKPLLLDPMGSACPHSQQQLHDQLLREKQRQAQQELELYRQQMKFYSEECWLWGTNDCSKDLK